MLEEIIKDIDAVDWSKLRTSHGAPADEVGEVLKELVTQDLPTKRSISDPCTYLGFLICSLYDIDTATVAFVQFAVRLLRVKTAKNRDCLLYLLLDCFQYGEENELLLEQPERYKLRIEIAQEIAKGLDIYIELTQHPDYKVRLRALALIASAPFRKSEWARIEEVYRHARKHETDERVYKAFPILDRRLIHFRGMEFEDLGDKYEDFLFLW